MPQRAPVPQPGPRSDGHRRLAGRLQRSQAPHQPQWHDARGFRSTRQNGIQQPTDPNLNLRACSGQGQNQTAS